MKVDKTTGKIQGVPETPEVEEHVRQIQVPTTGIIAALRAVREILSNIRWEYGNPESPLIFKTVQHDDGQFERIVRKGANLEDGIGFPAVFYHIIDARWLKETNRQSEIRADLRVRYILNRLNVHDNFDTEVEGHYVMERIKQEIELHRLEYEALTKHCLLNYYYKYESFDDSLQPWGISWALWVEESNIWVERNKRNMYIVFPPFANHSDQTDPETMNPAGHTYEDHPRELDPQSEYVMGGINPETTDSGD